jgi:hypothetical protein
MKCMNDVRRVGNRYQRGEGQHTKEHAMRKLLPLLTVFAFGIALGLGIAVYIAMRVQMMDMIYPALPAAWLIA